MNKRIKELEKLSIEIVNCGLNGTSTAERFNREKFAELIIQECAQVVDSKIDSDCGVANVWCEGKDLLKHFGVKS